MAVRLNQKALWKCRGRSRITLPYYPLVMLCSFCCAITVAMKEGEALHLPSGREMRQLDPEERKRAFQLQSALIRGHKSGKVKIVDVEPGAN